MEVILERSKLPTVVFRIFRTFENKQKYFEQVVDPRQIRNAGCQILIYGNKKGF